MRRSDQDLQIVKLEADHWKLAQAALSGVPSMNSDRPQCFKLTTHHWQEDTGLARLPTGILVSGLPAAFLSCFQVHNTRKLPLNTQDVRYTPT